ncbi:type II secretion system F family protein [Yersinia aleksiciae]|uniref:type II secretion system F family protein n=1 Tax=Yersinia aleksiciae TaxID=263819 RepID=UPI0011A6F6D8|nr:type II secretion system F family protein [Yersinia aleksiciae]
MKISLFIIMVLVGIILALKIKSRSNKVAVYNKINDQDKPQVKKENNKDEKNKSKNLSHFINLPFLLHNIVYSKLLIIALILTVMTVLTATGVIIINMNNLIMIVFITLLAALYLPKVIIKSVIAKRTESILKSLPFFIDITAACVQSGMTIDSSLNYAAKKFQLINPDLSLIILRMAKRAEINGLESAIKEFHQCSTAIEIRMFCSTLQYSISFGSTIYDQLIKLSQDIREMQLLVTEEKISKLSTKLTLPLFIFILIPFVVLVISPSVLELITYVQEI